METIRALGLLSGGLDSTLAARLLLEQGIQVEGIYFNTGFCHAEDQQRVPRGNLVNKVIRNEAKRAGYDLGIPIQIVRVGEEYLDLVRHPKHGRGSAFNPCIDCRIYMLKRAKEIMDREGFHFLFTGEVLGQRPMTQMRHTLALIARESGTEDILLRPLCALRFPPTLPEREGWVDRTQLMSITGRGRKIQISLADQFAITDYPTPAGGCCFLTDPNLTRRFEVLFSAKDPDSLTMDDFLLVKHGRHFLLGPQTRLIVGRDAVENLFLEGFKEGRHVLDAQDVPGPLALLDGPAPQDIFETALAITARYADHEEGACVPVVITDPQGETQTRTVLPMPASEVESLLI